MCTAGQRVSLTITGPGPSFAFYGNKSVQLRSKEVTGYVGPEGVRPVTWYPSAQERRKKRKEKNGKKLQLQIFQSFFTKIHRCAQLRRRVKALKLCPRNMNQSEEKRRAEFLRTSFFLRQSPLS